MNQPYWESEEPAIANTGKNILRYYEKANRLQVCMPNWVNDQGEPMRGKCVTLNLEAVYNNTNASALLRQIVRLNSEVDV